MINALAAAILALLTIRPGVYAPHVARQALPAVQWSTQRAEWIDFAARVSHEPHAAITALAMHESTLREDALSFLGAEGPMQLLPSTPHHNAWLKDCARDSTACTQKNYEQGAVALAKYHERCGSLLRAFHAYRVGHCGKPGPRSIATMRLTHQVNYRLKVTSPRPLRVARLP